MDEATVKFSVEDGSAEELAAVISIALSYGLKLAECTVSPSKGWFSSPKVWLKFSGKESVVRAYGSEMRRKS